MQAKIRKKWENKEPEPRKTTLQSKYRGSGLLCFYLIFCHFPLIRVFSLLRDVLLMYIPSDGCSTLTPFIV